MPFYKPNQLSMMKEETGATTPFTGGGRVGKGNAKRPGVYKTNDIDEHGNLSPQKNRAPGYQNKKSDNLVQSHHPIQDKWAILNVKGYDRNEAPAILLESSSGSPHAIISSMQRQRRAVEGFNTDIRHEFNIGYKEMIDAGVSKKDAQKVMSKAYKYFYDLGAFKY